MLCLWPEQYHLLQPGGTLFVAIENRFGAELLYRRKDHNKLYWTSFLPRRLADLVTRALKGRPYRTWTYHRQGLLALLAEAGFRDVRLFCPWPKYQDPATILPWGDTGAADYFRRTVLRKEHYLEYLLFSLLGRVGLDGFFSPAFIALARRS